MAKAAKMSAGTQRVHDQILSGEAPDNLRVSGSLSFAGNKWLKSLPTGLEVPSLDLSDCTSLLSLPKGLRVRRLKMSGSWNPQRLLTGLKCFDLDLAGTAIEAVPAGLHIEYRLDLTGCTALRSLPDGLKVGSLILRDCISLESLPERLECYFLDISGCTGISAWPREGRLEVGRLSARGGAQLRSLPAWITHVAQLDLRGCSNLRMLPEGLIVSSWIDVAGTHIDSLPASLKGVQLRWRGVPVDQRIAFSPELITAQEILAEPNAEKRRVLLERMGYETFLTHAHAETIDQDTDPGGPRRLLRVPMESDEALVCVSVLCPSTARQYVIRVPPTITTCHAAAAWIAGFDDPDDYRPLIET